MFMTKAIKGANVGNMLHKFLKKYLFGRKKLVVPNKLLKCLMPLRKLGFRIKQTLSNEYNLQKSCLFQKFRIDLVQLDQLLNGLTHFRPTRIHDSLQPREVVNIELIQMVLVSVIHFCLSHRLCLVMNLLLLVLIYSDRY